MVAVLTVLVSGACGPSPAFVARGREGSWHRVGTPAFSAGPSSSIAGLVAPGDGYGAWTAVGSVRDGRTMAAAWTSVDGTQWVRSDLGQDAARESEAAAATRRLGVAVVVGTVITPLGDRDGRIWTSRDGTTWSVAAVAAGGAGDQRLTSVAGGPLGFVAAGSDGSLPAVWSSPDGMSWTRRPGPFHASQQIQSVAIGGRGAVAVGTITTSGDVDGMAWFSVDGSEWRTVPLGQAGFTGAGDQAVHAVTAAGGGFVAVGDDASGERTVAVSWTSADGIAWRRQPASADMAEYPTADSTSGVSARSVAGTGPVIAVGGGYSLQVWTSQAGQSWTREAPPVNNAGSDMALVAFDGTTALVHTNGTLWLRRAGGSWSDVGTDSTAFLRSTRRSWVGPMIRAGSRYLAYGTDGDTRALWSSDDGGVWERQPNAESSFTGGRIDDFARFGDVTVAVGTADHPDGGTANVAAVWNSVDDGDSWERITATNPAFFVRGSTQLYAVAAGPHGVVAAGLSYDIRQTIDAHAWFSADGRTWRRAVEPPAWSGPGDQALRSVCALPQGGFLALGYSTLRGSGESWAWISRDGMAWEQSPEGGPRGIGGAQLQLSSCSGSAAGVIVVGNVPGEGGRDGALLLTPDGRSWRRLGAEALFSHADDYLIEVAAEGDRIVVSAVENDDTVIYSSADGGTTWRRHGAAVLGGAGPQHVYELVIAGDHVVMTGIDNASGAVWIGPAP